MAASTKSAISSSRLLSFDFEIFGKVQGVFFRKCTAEEGKQIIFAFFGFLFLNWRNKIFITKQKAQDLLSI